MTDFVEKEIEEIEEISVSDKHTLLLGYYNYTVILTYIGMFIGFVGILYATKNQISKALICLMVSGFCDMFDGAIASTRKRTKNEKRFGIQIDSLSDLICFGVLPAVITSARPGNESLKFIICGLYVLCALIRLSYFNVDEENRQEHSSGKREYYNGLPVTSMALIVPFVFQKSSGNYINLSVLLLAAVAFLLPFKIKKPNQSVKLIMMALGAFAFFKVLLGLI